MSDLTSLKGVSSIADYTSSEILEVSIAEWLRYGFLGIGGFANVSIGASGAYGGELSRLRLSEAAGYTKGQVWEAFRKDWVWETGVSWGTQPIHVSGVYVNNGFHPATGVGPYAHIVDYPRGRIVFASAISPTATVKAEYSYNYCQFYTADAPWWIQVQEGSLRADDIHFLQYGSGAWSIPPERRVQLPAVVVEATTDTRRKPLEIGNSTAITAQKVLLHVLADTPHDRKKIFDILSNQYEKRLHGIDLNRMAASGAFPLDSNGSPVSGAIMYPQLIRPASENGFFWKQIRYTNANGVGQMTDSPPYIATIAGTFEVDLP